MRKEIIAKTLFLFIIYLFILLPTRVNATVYTIKYYDSCGDAAPVLQGNVSDPSNINSLYLYDGERDGFTFYGWYSRENSDHIFKIGEPADLSEEINGSDIYLCALWKRDITYHLDGGENNKKNPSILFHHMTYDLEKPKKAGYTHQGWYSDSSFQNKITSIAGSNKEITDIYAKWALTDYKIVYCLDRGTNNAANPSKYNITSAITLNNPTRSGYTFVGWYSDTSYTKKVTAIVAGTTGNITLYAKWVPTEYKITYYLDRGTNNAANPSKYNITSAITLNNPTRAHYTFNGWYTDTTYTKKVTAISKGTTGNIKLYAKWVPADYTITYYLDKGTNNKNNPSKYNITSAFTLSNPTRSGYTFVGWYTDTTYTKKVTAISKGTTGNKKLYAKWTPTDYKLTYYLDRGTNDSSNPAKYNILTPTFVLKNAIKRGYTSLGWFTSSSYTDKITSIVKGTTGNKKLYVKWVPTEYTITYYLDRGTNNKNNPSKYNITSKITFSNPTKTGYNFVGWYSDSKYTKKVTAINTGTIGNLKLYAKWVPIDYTLTYYLDGGTNNTANPVKYNITTATFALKNPTKSGYTSLGWYTDSTYAERVTSIAKGSIGNKKLYAKWIKNVYTVNFNANGGSGTMKSISCKANNDCTLSGNSFTKKGYNFVGWNTKADGSGISYKNKEVVKNIAINNGVTLYASWQPNNFKIVFNGNGSTSGSMPSITCTYGKSCKLPENTFEKSYYEFAGWNTKKDGSGTKYIDEQDMKNASSTGTITLYATWEKFSMTTDRSVVKIRKGKSDSVNITFNYQGTIYYQNSDKSVVNCEWGEWEGSTIPLYINGVGSGNTTITITNSYDSRKLIILVYVEESPFETIEGYISDAVNAAKKANDYAKSSYESYNSTSYLAKLYIDDAIAYLKNAKTVANRTYIPEITQETYQTIINESGYDVYESVYSSVHTGDIVSHIDTALSYFSSALDYYNQDKALYFYSYTNLGAIETTYTEMYALALLIQDE